MQIFSVTHHPLGVAVHTEFNDITATMEFVQTLLANGLDCQVMTTVESCVHPRLFSGDAPPHPDHPLAGPGAAAAYATWLDSTKRCDVCEADVPNRDL